MDNRSNTLKRTPNNLIWCTICLKDLTRDDVWLLDDTRDGRLFCYDCAPDDAIREKDLS